VTIIPKLILEKPLTLAARSKELYAFARSNIGIVGSKPTRRIYYVFVLSYLGSGLATGSSPAHGVLPNCLSKAVPVLN
jgi:hypothetical protein